MKQDLDYIWLADVGQVGGQLSRGSDGGRGHEVRPPLTVTCSEAFVIKTQLHQIQSELLINKFDK